MSLSDDQIEQIIAKAQSSMNAAQSACTAHVAGEDSVLVLVPGFVPAPEKALYALSTQYGKYYQLVFLSDSVCGQVLSPVIAAYF